MRTLVTLLVCMTMVLPAFAHGGFTDAQVKQNIIEQSISSYPGRCPCPYNTDRAGRSCGGRSAYSRKGGASPLCYPRDVSQQMLKQWRQAHR